MSLAVATAAPEQLTDTSCAQVPVTCVRADLLWKFQVPSMKWSGATVNHNPHQPKASIFSLRDSVSEKFLSHAKKGQLEFTDTDTENSARWYLVPFDAETTTYNIEHTQFYLENVKTGHRLGQGSGNEAMNADILDLAMEQSKDSREDDLFVCRAVPQEWSQSFAQLMQGVRVLKRFHRDLLNKKIEMKIIKQKYLLPDVTVESGSQYTGPVLLVLEKVLERATSSSVQDMIKRDGVPDNKFQSLLGEIRLSQLIIDNILPALFARVPAEDIAEGKRGPYMLRAVMGMFRVLGVMAKEHDDNSKNMFRNIDKLQVWQGTGEFGVVRTLTDIFEGQEELMMTIKDSYIVMLWKEAMELQKSTYVRFLGNLLEVRGRPIRPNQDRVMKILKDNMTKAWKDWFCNFDLQATSSSGFHLELIKLAAQLCAGRHQESIDCFLGFGGGMTYDNVLRVIDNVSLGAKDTAKTRLHYVMLMRSMFVNREPYEIMDTVQQARIMPPLKDANNKQLSASAIETMLQLAPIKSVDPYKTSTRVKPPTPGFSDLKKVLLGVLASVGSIDVADVDSNAFLGEVVDLSRELVVFGLFDGNFAVDTHSDGVLLLGKESIVLALKLVGLIDGRDDDTSKVMDLPNDGLGRFRVDLLETKAVMTLKKKTLMLLDTLFKLRTSSKIESLLQQVVSSKLQWVSVPWPIGVARSCVLFSRVQSRYQIDLRGL